MSARLKLTSSFPRAGGRLGWGLTRRVCNVSTPSLTLPLQGGGDISVHKLVGGKFPILSTPWRELEKIRDTVCSELFSLDILWKGATASHQLNWTMCEAEQ